MTNASRAPALEFDSLDDVLDAMRANGHRVSTACRLVLDALFGADGPISAQFIGEVSGERGAELDPASVYRNLERLEKLGVVRHVHLGHGPGLYTLIGSGGKEFVACERCGRVTTLDPSDLDSIRAEIRERFGYTADFGHFPVIGLCAECEADTAGTDPKQRSHDPEVAHSHGTYVHSHPEPGAIHGDD